VFARLFDHVAAGRSFGRPNERTNGTNKQTTKHNGTGIAVWINYPHLREARVVAIEDVRSRHTIDQPRIVNIDSSTSSSSECFRLLLLTDGVKRQHLPAKDSEAFNDECHEQVLTDCFVIRLFCFLFGVLNCCYFFAARRS
jgi:hypothetical protein